MADVTNKQLHAYYLKTMGIEVWIRRQQPQLEVSTTLSEQSSTVEMTMVSGEEITVAASTPLPAVETATLEQSSVIMSSSFSHVCFTILSRVSTTNGEEL